MNQVETIKRKIKLKRQAIPQIRREIEEQEEILVLLRMRSRLEQQQKIDFDPAVSSRLDCVIYLLEN